MAHIIDISEYSDSRGSLCVFEQEIPFEIKRVYWIYNITAQRGGHRHKQAIQALACIHGSCRIYTQNKESEHEFFLDSPKEVLLLEPEDWHTFNNCTIDTAIIVFASKVYDKNDYIYEAY